MLGKEHPVSSVLILNMISNNLKEYHHEKTSFYLFYSFVPYSYKL